MIGWNPNYNWTYDQFKKVVDDDLVKGKKNSICLDTEHSDYHNEEQIKAWARDLGYCAEILDGGERIRVYKKSQK